MLLMRPRCSMFILLFFFIAGYSVPVHSQTNENPYQKEWDSAVILIEKGLPGSALPIVKKIYSLAKQEKKEIEIIRAIVYMIELEQNDEGYGQSNPQSIRRLEEEIQTTSFPEKALLQSLLADLYWSYLYDNFRWGYKNNPIKPFDKNDVSTWSVEQLQARIISLYFTSIKEARLLQKISLEKYDAITSISYKRLTDPSLYDFLANRVIEFFINKEDYITRPGYVFAINQKETFAPAAVFSKTKFTTKDTGSVLFHGIRLFQELLRSLNPVTNRIAFIDADIKRLNFINIYGVMPDKDMLYENALKDLIKKFPGDSTAAFASYLLADLHYNKGHPASGPVIPENKLALKKAKQICDDVIAKFPNSLAAEQCRGLIQMITKKDLSAQIEKVNIPRLPFRLSLEYKNLNKVYFRLIPESNREASGYYSRESQNFWEERKIIKPFRSWSQDIPDPGDHLDHRVELKIDALPVGTYRLLISYNEDFLYDENITASLLVEISNISYAGNDDGSVFVLDRTTGLPLPGAKVQNNVACYNFTTKAYDEYKAEEYITDENGYFKYSGRVTSCNYKVRINYGNDSLVIDNKITDRNEWLTSASIYSPTNTRAYLFTDRAIYRPGQLVYFKGLVFKKDRTGQYPSACEALRTRVTFIDANQQGIDSVILVTNEYGSYSGSFRVPENKRNGIFFIEDNGNDISLPITVEEYKRPKFTAEIRSPGGSYKLGDTIRVNGFAKALAGNSLTGATVKYNVMRFPHSTWRGKRRYGMSLSRLNENMQVAFGETKTNARGEFTINFKAIAHDIAERKYRSSWDFEITADITDLNGETKSISKIIVISFHSIQLSLDLPEKIKAGEFKEIVVNTFNSANVFEPVKLDLTITSVLPPGRIFRERLWSAPDQFVMSKEDYYKQFPLDLYTNEDEPSSWPKGKEILKDTFTTNEGFGYRLNKTLLLPGWYAVEINGTDKHGEKISARSFVRLFNDKDPYPAPIAGLEMDIIRSKAEPGEKIIYTANTSFDHIWLIRDHLTLEKDPEREIEIVNTKSKRYEITVTENDRGGKVLNWLFVKNNRVYTGSKLFVIPWTNKQLDISYETFRDKLLPGAEEKWKVKISGSKKEKVSAELLASMYDASLDLIKPHQWIEPALYRTILNMNRWQSLRSFGNESGHSSNTYKKEEVSFLPDEYSFFRFFVSDSLRQFSRIGFWSYGMSDISNPRLMRLPKPVFNNEAEAEEAMANGEVLPDTDGDGITDQFDLVQNTPEEAAEIKRKRVKQRKKDQPPATSMPVKILKRRLSFFPILLQTVREISRSFSLFPKVLRNGNS